MSLRLPCPHCGHRPVEEFVHGEVPAVPESITDPDARDLDRAFMRDNAEGAITERWFHALGCRRWMTLRRDTRYDEVLRSRPSSSTAP
jgi:heterotetrameric sarcosine oxidase delta subunit